MLVLILLGAKASPKTKTAAEISPHGRIGTEQRMDHRKKSPIFPITDPWDWSIYLHEWLIFMANAGKYTIHGCYGYLFGIL